MAHGLQHEMQHVLMHVSENLFVAYKLKGLYKITAVEGQSAITIPNGSCIVKLDKQNSP